MEEHKVKERVQEIHSRFTEKGLKAPGEFYSPETGVLKAVKEAKFSDQSLLKLCWNLCKFLRKNGIKVYQPDFVVRANGSRKESQGLGERVTWVVGPDGIADKAPESSEDNSVAGWYVRRSDRTTLIELKIRASYRLKEVLAILGHETCHHVLIGMGIKWEDTAENEIMTDLATVWLGFGHWLYRGYRRNEVSEAKLGYVDQKALWNAMDFRWGNKAMKHAIAELRVATDEASKC